MTNSPRAYNGTSNIKRLLTPKGTSLAPGGDIRAFRERLEDIPAFAELEETAVRRTAVDLNRLLLDVRDTPAPNRVAASLDDVALSAERLARTLKGLDGVSVSVLTGVEELFPPYLMVPRGVQRSKTRTVATDDHDLKTAFEPELRVLRDIEEREQQGGEAASTNDTHQLALLKNYENALTERANRQTSAEAYSLGLPPGKEEKYIPWRGPPVRTILLDPFIQRLTALGTLAKN